MRELKLGKVTVHDDNRSGDFNSGHNFGILTDSSDKGGRNGVGFSGSSSEFVSLHDISNGSKVYRNLMGAELLDQVDLVEVLTLKMMSKVMPETLLEVMLEISLEMILETSSEVVEKLSS